MLKKLFEKQTTYQEKRDAFDVLVLKIVLHDEYDEEGRFHVNITRSDYFEIEIYPKNKPPRINVINETPSTKGLYDDEPLYLPGLKSSIDLTKEEDFNKHVRENVLSSLDGSDVPISVQEIIDEKLQYSNMEFFINDWFHFAYY